MADNEPRSQKERLMNQPVSHYDTHGARFVFDPPVEVGSHTVESFTDLVTIAAVGRAAHPNVLRLSREHAIAAMLGRSDDPLNLLIMLNGLLEGRYRVTLG